ncbi:hypothetical protein DEIPH_ctg017orf0055 [Deinococcus phoenicis]|uniref:Uncharacterized protein n=1 Tax=Deinococcus phoenicis TaxID=1476583 RepID=A0A016QRE9_9DEIO|nr:hypothetical protein [Deinococcus phoenicis]EYB68720.1 hypothetical protein DEIPH_ctg017orf0055 [Deinococcus phoenicis]
MSTSAEHTLLDLFDLRCQARREVAEALSRIPEGSRYAQAGARLSRQYLDSVHSEAALTAIIREAHDLEALVRGAAWTDREGPPFREAGAGQG